MRNHVLDSPTEHFDLPLATTFKQIEVNANQVKVSAVTRQLEDSVKQTPALEAVGGDVDILF